MTTPTQSQIRDAISKAYVHSEKDDMGCIIRQYIQLDVAYLPILQSALDTQKTAEPCGGEPYRLSIEEQGVMRNALRKSATVIEQQQPAAPTQIDAGELEAAVAFRREMAEAARKRHDNFYGMNKDRPPIHDVILWEAARAHLSKLSGGDAPQSDMVAVPREVIEEAAESIRFALNMDDLSDAEFSKLDLSLAMLQPYTRETK